MIAFPLKFESAVIVPEMWDGYVGGLDGFLHDLEEQIPGRLVDMAQATHGLRLSNQPHLKTSRKQREMESPTETYVVYKVVAEAWFVPTRCVAQYNYHHEPHSEECSSAGRR